METVPNLLAAIGRFHPVVLHFPIGLLAGVACLELWMAFRPSAELRHATGILLALACGTAVVTAVCGLLLARSGGYDEALLTRHRLFGVGTALLALGVALAYRRLRRSAGARALALYRLTLAACVLAMAGAGYYGGMSTHGSRTPFGMVAAVRAAFARDDAQPAAVMPTTEDDLSQRAALPILESHCYECHGAEKQK